MDEHALVELAVESCDLFLEEADDASDCCKKGVIVTTLYVCSWVELGAALANDD